MEQGGAPGQIHLGVVIGPDPGFLEYVEPLLRHLEREWFHLRVLAPFDPPAPWGAWSQSGEWSRLDWPRGVGAMLRAERYVRTWAQGLDVVDLWGPTALAAGVRSGAVAVYSRFGSATRGAARRLEAAWARRAHAVVAMGGAGEDRSFPLAQTPVDLLLRTAEAPGAAPPPGGPARLWVGPGSAGPLVDLSREVATAAGVRLEEVAYLDGDGDGDGDEAGEAPYPSDAGGFWGARAVLLPFGPEGAPPYVLDAALYAGAAVVATRVPGVVGRVRCPIEALMVDGQDAGAWRETVGELLQDLEWQALLQKGAAQWRDLNGAGGQVRILQGVYAGTLASRTGRCPICPQDAAGSLTG